MKEIRLYGGPGDGMEIGASLGRDIVLVPDLTGTHWSCAKYQRCDAVVNGRRMYSYIGHDDGSWHGRHYRDGRAPL